MTRNMQCAIFEIFLSYFCNEYRLSYILFIFVIFLNKNILISTIKEIVLINRYK